MSTITATALEVHFDGRVWTDGAIARQINEQHHACQSTYQHALTHAYEAGRLLAAAKEQLPKGSWEAWVQEHVEFSLRTAQVYMQVAESSGILEAQSSAPRSISAALREVATPRERTPSPAQSTDQLREAGGGRSPELERRLAESRARTAQDAWSEPERRKLSRARDQLEDVLSRLDDGANTTSLSRDSIGRLVREQAVAARQAASVLDDLAFSFER